MKDLKDGQFGQLTRVMVLMLIFYTSEKALAQKVTVKTGNEFYRINDNVGGGTLYKYKVIAPFKATLIDKTSFLQIVIDESIIDSVTGIIDSKYATEISASVPHPTGFRAELSQGSSAKYYFSEDELDLDPSKVGVLKYRYNKFMLQTLTIPLKFRPKVKSLLGIDSLSRQVDSKFDIGFAVGWKFTSEKWANTKNLLGTNNSKFSIAPGLLMNFGSTLLDDKSTAPKIASSRRALTISGGFVCLVGWNNFNFGLAGGQDFVTGENNKDWIYTGKKWWGLLIALDLLK